MTKQSPILEWVNAVVDEGHSDVFRALADPSRRALMDALFTRDGQTLNGLCDVLPEMTRFGVMKHLKVLAEADLVVTERAGRSKLHYLNPVPIRVLYERWISKYAEPTVQALTELATQMNKGDA